MPKFKHLLTHTARTVNKGLIPNIETLKIGTIACLPTINIVKQFQSNTANGLSASEARRRLVKFGKNEAVVEKKTFLAISFV